MQRNTYPLSLRGSNATAAIRSFPPPSLRSRISGCGNPFSFRVLQILSRFAFRMTHRLVIATTVKCAINCCPVIAKVRVSGGHLCGAEAPTEPAGETHKRLWQSAPLRVLRILSRSAFRMTSRSVVAAPAVGRLKRLNLLNSLFLLHIKAKNVKILLAEPFGRGYFLCSLKFKTAWLSFRANRY